MFFCLERLNFESLNLKSHWWKQKTKIQESFCQCNQVTNPGALSLHVNERICPSQIRECLSAFLFKLTENSHQRHLVLLSNTYSQPHAGVQTQQQESADTAPGANHKYFKCHHSHLHSQQKGENKVPVYVQHVTSTASLATISWTSNNVNCAGAPNSG